MIHSTVPPHQINRASLHATVSEFWYVLTGHGEIWRDAGSEGAGTPLLPGTAIDIPVGTAFQYRNVGDEARTSLPCESCPILPSPLREVGGTRLTSSTYVLS